MNRPPGAGWPVSSWIVGVAHFLLIAPPRHKVVVEKGEKGQKGKKGKKGKKTALALAVAGVGALKLGCVDQHCFESLDCPAPMICGSTGRCRYECSRDVDCGVGFACVDHLCRLRQQEEQQSSALTCPDDMAAVAGVFCMDRYEASRPDATSTNPGEDDSYARSVAGVLPWQVDSNLVAATACAASGKRLCSPDEWFFACSGPDRHVYSYGDEYQAATCNGIDAFGRAGFHLTPTGAFASCVNSWGVYDLHGNLWEHVAGGDDTMIRGGAYNCSDSATLHRCDYVPATWAPSARGFRCCSSASEASAGQLSNIADAARTPLGDDEEM